MKLFVFGSVRMCDESQLTRRRARLMISPDKEEHRWICYTGALYGVPLDKEKSHRTWCERLREVERAAGIERYI